jgi:hypothetical protein
MTRLIQISALVLVLGFLGACAKKEAGTLAEKKQMMADLKKERSRATDSASRESVEALIAALSQ